VVGRGRKFICVQTFSCLPPPIDRRWPLAFSGGDCLCVFLRSSFQFFQRYRWINDLLPHDVIDLGHVRVL
jgi:hypothetical protein